MKYIKFSDCLKLMLSNLGISSNRLSKAINVDSSLVNRWINGKRIPSYHTAYIEQISEFLAKNIYNTYQKQRISDLITEACGSNDNSLPIKDQIFHMLSEAQGYSLECYQKELKEHKSTGKKAHSLYSEEITALGTSSSFSAKDKILIGQQMITQTTLHLLEDIGKKRPRKDDTIYIVLDDLPTNIYIDHELKNFQDSLIRIMENGWNLLLLIKPIQDIDCYIDFINFLKPLIHSNKFHLYYMKRYDSYVMGEKLIIVPNTGALICLHNELPASLSNAFYFTNQAAVTIYLSHFKELMARGAKPLIEHCESSLHYNNHLLKLEEAEYSRFLYRHCFDMTIFPRELYLRLLKKRDLTSVETDRSIALYTKRQEAFLHNIQHYQYWDIYETSGILDLIKEHQISVYNYSGAASTQIETNEIIELLKNIIYLLEMYENYHIAFIMSNQDQDNGIYPRNIHCLVKERQSALIEINSPGNDLAESRIISEEPMLVNGFYEYFKNKWEHIAPIYKNKKDIIHWLKNEIEVLLKGSSSSD